MDNDIRFMRRALALARRGLGKTSPNPAVGAVVVRDGRIVGEGYHHKAGSPHAEVIALAQAGTQAKGATLYVNLEPCCHTEKKTPPCTVAIIESGITRLVVAMEDPNPRVAGRGLQHFQSSGIEILRGVQEDEARRLNEVFCKHITTNLPFVTLKIAETLDGRIATASGQSKWITGETARKHVHRLRSLSDAILVGVETVLRDDPLLTVRAVRGRSPVRIVVDSTLRIPLSAKVVLEESGLTIIATTGAAPADKAKKLEERGVRILKIAPDGKRVSMKALMAELGRMDITSVLVEGGAEIAASALESGIVDKVAFFIAPKIMGGRDSIGAVGGASPVHLTDAVELKDMTVRRVGEDLVVEGYVKK